MSKFIRDVNDNNPFELQTMYSLSKLSEKEI